MVEAANSPDCLDVDSNAELNRFLGHPVKVKQ